MDWPHIARIIAITIVAAFVYGVLDELLFPGAGRRCRESTRYRDCRLGRATQDPRPQLRLDRSHRARLK